MALELNFFVNSTLEAVYFLFIQVKILDKIKKKY